MSSVARRASTMVTNGERPSAVALGQQKRRALNEELVSNLDPPAVSLRILCECGRSDCTTELDASQGLYRRVLRRPTQFIVADGHEVIEVDRVVQRLGTLTIVQSTYVGEPVSPAA